MKELLTQRTINLLVGVFVVINVGLLGTLWMNKQSPQADFDDLPGYRSLEEMLRMDFGLNEEDINQFRQNRKTLRHKVEKEFRIMHQARQEMLNLTAQGTPQKSEMNSLIRKVGDAQANIERYTFEFLEQVSEQLANVPKADRIQLFQEIGETLRLPNHRPPPH